jgi:hypothetical protein
MLDACVLINILASGRAQEILTSSGYSFGICTVVSKESIYLRASDPNAPPEAVDLSPLVQAGCLSVYGLAASEEQAAYINYAADLDDGEAMTLALASCRGFLVSTDDRKARRIFREDTGDAGRLLCTAQILKIWSQAARLTAPQIKELLLEIFTRGRFFPHSSDPEFAWWSKAIV